MFIKIFKNENLLFDLDSNKITQEQSVDLLEKLKDEKVESTKFEFVDNMSLNDVNEFLLNPVHEKVLTQTLILK